MAPTPEQLIIQEQPNLLQAPQVQEQIAQAPILREGEVSMAAPNQWIGPIDYGLNWYALGAQAFKVAGDLYGDLLQYNVAKTGAKINDLQFDYRTKMENEFASSISTQPKDFVSRPDEVDYNKPFDASKKYQEEFKQKANEIIGFKDSDGNLIDVFAEDYDFEKTGSAWFNIVENARFGLMRISQDAERVQRDVLESFKNNYEASTAFEKWKNGGYLPESELKKISPLMYPMLNGIDPITGYIEEVGTENINMSAKTPNGSPVLIARQNQIFLNPQATEENIVEAIGLSGYNTIRELDVSQIAASARGVNLPHNFANEIRQTLRSENISPAQAIRLKTDLKYLSQNKLSEVLTSGTDFNPLERARLMWAYAKSGAYPGMEELTPESFSTGINSITQPTANQIASFNRIINRAPIEGGANIQTATSGEEALEFTRRIFPTMMGAVSEDGTVINQDIYNISSDRENYIDYLQTNSQVMPLLYGALIEYQTLRENGIEQEQAEKLIGSNLNVVVITDDTNKPFVSRVIQQKLPTEWKKSMESDLVVRENQGESINEAFKETLKTDKPETTVFRYMSLQTTLPPNDLDSFVVSVDSSLIPTPNSPIKPETRIELIRAARSVENINGQNRSESISLGEATRVAIATNPSVLKKFNNNRIPATEQEAITIAAQIYDTIGPAEMWGWSFAYNSGQDQIMNSPNGGIPFKLKSINYTDSNGELQNLLSDTSVVSQVNANNITAVDQRTGIPFWMLENSSLNLTGKEEFYKNFERLSSGTRAKAFEFNYGTNPLTSPEDTGLIAAARFLSRTQNEKGTTTFALTKKMAAKEITQLSREISQHEAKIGAANPEFLDYVADILADSYRNGKTKATAKKEYLSALSQIVSDPQLFEYITSYDVDEDKMFTGLDLVDNLHRATIGFTSNIVNVVGDGVEKENTKLFWERALSNSIRGNSYLPPNKTVAPEEPTVFGQVMSGAGQLGKATVQTLFPIDLLMDTEYSSIWSQAANAIFRPGATTVDFDLKPFGKSEQIKTEQPKSEESEIDKLQNKRTSPGAVSDKPYIPLISEYEGLRTEAYWDDAGKVWTIGKGTTTYPDGSPVKEGDKITEEQAQEFLINHVNNKIIPRLQDSIPTWNDLNENQRAALISFAYNLGENFYGRRGFETITKALSDKKNLNNVPNALMLYVKAGGKKLKGLERRRKAEADLWVK